MSAIVNTQQSKNHSQCDIEEYKPAKKTLSFCGKGIASAAFMVIPHIVMNIGLGALKGLEKGATGPAEFLNRHAKKVGKENSKLSAICGHAGTFVGTIIGVVAAVPGLLIGTVVGLGRTIYTFPRAMKTCFNDGCSAAARQTAADYNVDMRKIATIGAVTSLIIAGFFIGVAGAFAGLPLALVITVLEAPAIVGGVATLAYTLSHKSKTTSCDGVGTESFDENAESFDENAESFDENEGGISFQRL